MVAALLILLAAGVFGGACYRLGKHAAQLEAALDTESLNRVWASLERESQL